MFCLIRRGLSTAGLSAEALLVTSSGALLDSADAFVSEGFLVKVKGLLLRAPFRSSSRGEPGMVFFALPGVDFLITGAAGVFSEGGASRVRSESRLWGVLVVLSTSSLSLMAEKINRIKRRI